MSELGIVGRWVIDDVSLEVRRLVNGFTKKRLQSQTLRLKEIVKVGMRNLNASFAECVEDESPSSRLSLEQLADMFLQMTRSIEDLLGDLLEGEIRRYRGAALSDQFTRSF
ncbi:hypothetical protein F4803DRAFT_549356 [Xylaria telfairii]|nr:hypothetical protein F4803DRAFT_549356 [Xylaria telfairii]